MCPAHALTGSSAVVLIRFNCLKQRLRFLNNELRDLRSCRPKWFFGLHDRVLTLASQRLHRGACHSPKLTCLWNLTFFCLFSRQKKSLDHVLQCDESWSTHLWVHICRTTSAFVHPPLENGLVHRPLSSPVDSFPDVHFSKRSLVA